MKTFIYLLIFLFNGVHILSQANCDIVSNPSLPPSPYRHGSFRFDGKGDFLRSGDLNSLEFHQQTTDSFSITSKFRVTKMNGPQYIFGKFYSAGWFVSYNTNGPGYISFHIGDSTRNVFYLGQDSSWHEYRIDFSKSSEKLFMYVDNILICTYNNFTYTDLANTSAFSVGNAGLINTYGPGSVNTNTGWFGGEMDYLNITVNGTSAVNYNFNEFAGQVARDSAAYFYSDRTYPGISACGLSHLMLGFMPSQDTCDPEWVTNDPAEQTRFSPLATGLESWHSGPNGNYFTEHFSMSMTVWDGKLINGGYFNLAGGIPARNIASWDGTNWSPLGGGTNHEVTSIAGYNGNLYATGYFDSAGTVAASCIAMWDGTGWNEVGGGLNLYGNVLKVFNGDLIVGGWFSAVGETYAPYIARWDGTEWHSMNIGMTGPVYALEEFEGELYAAGSFQYAGIEECNGIARWDGFKWNPVGTGAAGTNYSVNDLTVYNGELYAGGSFITMNGILCYNIAKYNGLEWNSVGTGAKGSNCFPSQGYISDMKVSQGGLYVVGMFTRMNEVPANKFARLYGTNWCGIEYGIDMKPRSMEIFDGGLIINGDFYSASGVKYNNIVKYTPKSNLTGTGNLNNIPGSFSLSQNYPNPFNPETKIKYSIPANTGGEKVSVKLIVYDISGREAAVLVDQKQQAGEYEVLFKASGLSSGVYFYSLNSGDFKVTKKMVVVK